MVKVCSEGSHAIILAFDLTSIESLTFIEDLYKNMHECNDTAKYFVVGTKFDHYFELSDQEKFNITEKAKNFAKDIGSNCLIYCSDTKSINIKKLFQILIGSVFGLTPKIEQIDDYTKPIIIYDLKKD